jgi:hypothetical protein
LSMGDCARFVTHLTQFARHNLDNGPAGEQN